MSWHVEHLGPANTFLGQIELENIFFPSLQVQKEKKWSKLGDRA